MRNVLGHPLIVSFGGAVGGALILVEGTFHLHGSGTVNLRVQTFPIK